MSGNIGAEIMAGYIKFILKIVVITAIIIGLIVFLIVKACGYDRMIKYTDTEYIRLSNGNYLMFCDSHTIKGEPVNYKEVEIILLKRKIEKLQQQINKLMETDSDKLNKEFRKIFKGEE